MWTEGPAGDEPDGVESLVTFDIRPDGNGTLLTPALVLRADSTLAMGRLCSR
jgi:hypothetical protein